MVFTVFSTPADRSCVLAVRADRSWNVSIYVGFCASTGESHGIYSVFACFLKANFFDEVRSYGFYSVLYTSSLLLRVVFTYVFARPAAKSMVFFVVWLFVRRQFFHQVPCRHVTLTVRGGRVGGGCEPVWHIPVTGCAFAPHGCKKKKPSTGFASH